MVKNQISRSTILSDGLWTQISAISTNCFVLLLLLSRFSHVQLCAAAHQAPPSLGFSRQEHWSGLPFPSPVHESEKWKWSRSVVSDSSRPRGLQPTRPLRPWDFPGKRTGVGCHCLLRALSYSFLNTSRHKTYFLLCYTSKSRWWESGNVKITIKINMQNNRIKTSKVFSLTLIDKM